MRIVSGIYGGRRLRVPKGDRVRPTTDRVKESLFAILRDDLPGARCLDLFAGSGNLGIEALSRGAAHVTFVESQSVHIQIIKENLTSLGIGKENATVLRGDGRRVLNEFAENERQFDLIFLDPPYDTSLAQDALQVIGSCGVLAPEGVVVVEHARQKPPANFYGSLTRVRVQDYGYSVISFYRQVVAKGKESSLRFYDSDTESEES